VSVLGRLVVVQGDSEDDTGGGVQLLSCDKASVAETSPDVDD
jgi:hypothetical protein